MRTLIKHIVTIGSSPSLHLKQIAFLQLKLIFPKYQMLKKINK